MAEHGISIRSAEQTVAALPHLLTYEPRQSLLVVFSKNDRLIATSRIDLPANEAQVNEATTALIDNFQNLLKETSPTQAVIIAVREPFDLEADRKVALNIADHLGMQGIEVLDVLATDGTAIGSIACGQAGCLCSKGMTVSQELRDWVAAEFIAMGAPAPAKSRESLDEPWRHRDVLAHIEEATTVGREAAAAFVATDEETLAAYRRTQLDDVRQATSMMTAPTVSAGAAIEVARVIGAASVDVKLRDALIVELASLDADDMLAYAQNMTNLAVTMPPEPFSTAATLSGTASWLRGDGSRAGIALEQALRAKPDNKIAELVSVAVARGLPPYKWRDVVIGKLGTAANALGVSEPALAAVGTSSPAVSAPALGL